MKTVMNTFTRMSVVLIAVLTMSFAPTTGTPEKFENPAELKYIGGSNNHPQFLLNLNNKETDEFTIIIRNTAKEILYKERVSGANISRKYQLNTEETNASGVTFEVVSKNNKNRVVYAVKETTRLVQDVSITEL